MTKGASASLTDDEEGTGFGIKYDMGGGMTIAASTTEVEDKDKHLLEKTKNTQQILVKLFIL